MARLASLGPLAFVACLVGACAPSRSSEPTRQTSRAATLVADLRARGVLPVGAPGAGGLQVVVPARAQSALRIAASADVTLEVGPLGARDQAGHFVDGATVFEDADHETDVVYTASPAHVEEIRVLRSPSASNVARYELRVGPGVATLRLVAGRVQVVDRAGLVRIESAPVVAVDALGVHRAGVVRLTPQTKASWTLETEVDVQGLVYPIAIDPAWTPAGSLATGRMEHVAVRLPSGKVLVAGGVAGTTVLSDAELYDPATNTWSAAGAMSTVRRAASAVLLSTGKVLVAGGHASLSYPFTDLTSADLYDPATGTWSAAAPLNVGRAAAAMVTLPSGKVLFAAGYYNNSAEIYDPAANTFTTVAALSSPRWSPTGSLLPSGKVLVTGGVDGSGYTQSVTELYDPATNTWSPGAAMAKQRSRHAAATLPSGKILVAGGNPGAVYLSDAEVYDPSTDGWTTLAPMALGRSGLALATLPSGHVLAVGGNFSSSTAEVFDPSAAAWRVVTGDGATRLDPTVTLLPSGLALVAGGSSGGSTFLFGELALGAACTQNGECVSAHCVDGVCCSTACAGTCSACDVTGAKGTCTTVAGAPHGSRSCAPYDVCAGGACATSCATTTDCAADFFCSSGKCVPTRSNGLACSAGTDCKSGLCVDGVCCGAACGGQCEACDVPGMLRHLRPRRWAAPRGAHRVLYRGRARHPVRHQVRRRGPDQVRLPVEHRRVRRRRVQGRHRATDERVQRQRAVHGDREDLRGVRLRGDGVQGHVRGDDRLRRRVLLQGRRVHRHRGPRDRLHDGRDLRERPLRRGGVLRERELRERLVVRDARQEGHLREDQRRELLDRRRVRQRRVRRRRVLRDGLQRAVRGLRPREQQGDLRTGGRRAARHPPALRRRGRGLQGPGVRRRGRPHQVRGLRVRLGHHLRHGLVRGLDVHPHVDLRRQGRLRDGQDDLLRALRL